MNQASGNKFEIGTVIGQAWEGFKSNAGILIGITAIQMVILYGFNFIIAMVVMVPFEKQQEKLMADLNTITGQSWEIDGPIFDVGENQSDAKQPEAKLPKPDAKKETKTESKTEPASLNSMIWEQAVLGGISGFFLGFINVFFQLGWIVISLKIIRGESPKIGDLFSQWRRYGTGLLASLMVSVLFMIGLVLLIIPGIIVGLTCFLTLWYIVDQDMGAVQAIKASFAATRGSWCQIFLFGLVCMGMGIATMCTCGLGVLVLLPWLSLASAHIYLALSGAPGGPAKGDEKPGDEVYAESPA